VNAVDRNADTNVSGDILAGDYQSLSWGCANGTTRNWWLQSQDFVDNRFEIRNICALGVVVFRIAAGKDGVERALKLAVDARVGGEVVQKSADGTGGCVTAG